MVFKPLQVIKVLSLLAPLKALKAIQLKFLQQLLSPHLALCRATQ